MIDYLSGIASQVINPPRAVSPALRTPFDVPPPETTDLPFAETTFAETAFPDAIHQDASPANRSEVHNPQTTEATITGPLDDPITPLAPEPSTTRRRQRNAASDGLPEVPDSPVESEAPNERQKSGRSVQPAAPLIESPAGLPDPAAPPG